MEMVSRLKEEKVCPLYVLIAHYLTTYGQNCKKIYFLQDNYQEATLQVQDEDHIGNAESMDAVKAVLQGAGTTRLSTALSG